MTFDAELLRVSQDRRGLRQPLHLLRDPADPRRLPQPHDGSIEEEALALVENGAKELILIAQDTTRYGLDLYGSIRSQSCCAACAESKLHWIRVLYCYPDAITDRLLGDCRRGKDRQIHRPAAAARLGQDSEGDEPPRRPREPHGADAEDPGEDPGVTLRTTLITGFPGETEADFTELAEFVKEVQFERLGCFAYSQEEDARRPSCPARSTRRSRTTAPSSPRIRR